MKAYIDVRGSQPLLISGMVCTELTNAPRGITVEEAEALISEDADQFAAVYDADDAA